jgi:hypothetical protein
MIKLEMIKTLYQKLKLLDGDIIDKKLRFSN